MGLLFYLDFVNYQFDKQMWAIIYVWMLFYNLIVWKLVLEIYEWLIC